MRLLAAIMLASLLTGCTVVRVYVTGCDVWIEAEVGQLPREAARNGEVR